MDDLPAAMTDKTAKGKYGEVVLEAQGLAKAFGGLQAVQNFNLMYGYPETTAM